jgi:hypothetical protein
MMSPVGVRSRPGSVPTVIHTMLGLGFLLATVATVVVVYTDEVRWLKLAVLLGVWAALMAAIAVERSTRDVRSADQRTEQNKRVYELELHREISARREHDMGVAEAAREDADSRHRDELVGLREQLDRLNSTLSGLLDGDKLFDQLGAVPGRTRPGTAGSAGISVADLMAAYGSGESSPLRQRPADD